MTLMIRKSYDDVIPCSQFYQIHAFFILLFIFYLLARTVYKRVRVCARARAIHGAFISRFQQNMYISYVPIITFRSKVYK